MSFDNFINISLTIDNLDRFYARKSILAALTEALPHLSGKLLDAGCGQMPYQQYILDNSKVESYTGLDIDSALNYDEKIKPDVLWDGKIMPFDDEVFDCVIATEVLEHCPEPEVFLKEVYRVLNPGGVFFFTIPFLWNLHEVPHDEYRYTPFSLGRHLQNAGFKDIDLKPTGGWHAAMAQMLGLWARRSPMSLPLKKFFSYSALLVIPIFLRYARKEQVSFSERQMITGISGMAYK